jgi:hypothetical protein
MLGDKYEITAAGAEGSFQGYYYKNLGLIFVFEDDDSLSFIDCDDKFEINGAKTGMNFAQIQALLGEAQIEETWFESPDNKAYEITYKIDGCIYWFMSFYDDGNDSNLKMKPIR